MIQIKTETEVDPQSNFKHKWQCSERMMASYRSDVTACLTPNFLAYFSAPKDLIFRANYNLS